MWVVVYFVTVFVVMGTGHGAVAIPVALTDDVWTNTVGGKQALHRFVTKLCSSLLLERAAWCGV